MKSKNTSDNVQTFPHSTPKCIYLLFIHPDTHCTGKYGSLKEFHAWRLRPTKAIEEAQRCAEKMEYQWVKNTDPALPFDAFMFRQAAIVAPSKSKRSGMRSMNMPLSSTCLPKKSTRPLPQPLLRELWIRTQKRAGMVPVLYSAGYHGRDRVQLGRGVHKPPLPGR